MAYSTLSPPERQVAVLDDPDVRKRLPAFREEQTAAVLEHSDPAEATEVKSGRGTAET